MADEPPASGDNEKSGPKSTAPLKMGPPKGKKKTPSNQTSDESEDAEPAVSTSNKGSKVSLSKGKGKEITPLTNEELTGIDDERWASRPRNRAEVLNTVVRRPPPPWVDPDRWYAALNTPDDR